MAIRIAQRLTRIVYLLGIQQPLKDGFISLEDGAVLVQIGHIHLVGHILKRFKVLRIMCTEVEEAVTVVVDKPSVIYLDGCRTLHHLTCKGFAGFAPRTVWRRGKGHLDVALRACIVLQHHHVVLLASLHQCGIDARETRVYHQFRRAELLEVLCRCVVETVVVLVVFLSVRELVWNA